MPYGISICSIALYWSVIFITLCLYWPDLSARLLQEQFSPRQRASASCLAGCPAHLSARLPAPTTSRSRRRTPRSGHQSHSLAAPRRSIIHSTAFVVIIHDAQQLHFFRNHPCSQELDIPNSKNRQNSITVTHTNIHTGWAKQTSAVTIIGLVTYDWLLITMSYDSLRYFMIMT